MAKFLPSEDTRRRARLVIRRRKRSAQEIGQQADSQIEKLLIRRFERLVFVRRFVGLWVGLFVLLIFSTVIQLRSMGKYYQTSQPADGGVFSEGLVGTFTNASPLYATGTANEAVSRVVFSGLFKYDTTGQLVGDLARTIKIDKSEKNYIVSLKTGISWHDDQPFTADDVVFTYRTIQNGSAQSPLFSSWQDIVVSKVDDYTINFRLPNPLAAFPYSLTNGIVPEHILNKIEPRQMRSAQFNTAPVGTGPFKWKFVQVDGSPATGLEQHITLAPFDKYWSGKPRMDAFSFTTFTDENKLLEAYKSKKINAISGLNDVPEDIAADAVNEVYATPLTSAVMAFFNNSRNGLNDVSVRKALVHAIDTKDLVGDLKNVYGLVLSPLLKFQLGYDGGYVQAGYNPATANQLLDAAGYTRGPDGMRSKSGQPLEFSLVAQNTGNYTIVAKYLQKKWAELGVKTIVTYTKASDLQSDIIATHNYDILIHGISIGTDPDVYAYWDSTQASITSLGRLNLSEYKSKTADQALESARTRSDPAVRAVKYQTFVSTWVQDAPALAIYQPKYVYVSRGPIHSYQKQVMITPTDRYSNVHEWTIRQVRK